MYKLMKNSLTGQESDYVLNLQDKTLVHKQLNENYLKWLAEGNTPEPADE
jgi:hypothetical protein